MHSTSLALGPHSLLNRVKEAGHWLDRPIIREKGGLALCQRFFPEGACVKYKSTDRTKIPHTDAC